MTNPLIARFANEPVLVNPILGDRFKACLEALSADPNSGKLLASRADTNNDDFWNQESWKAAYRPYVIKDSILEIPVQGVLLHNFPYAAGSFATGYDYIWRAFQRGCGDFSTGLIKGIALICDTPGGMVAGCFDMVDKMHALKQQVGVPVRGFAQESAYSAGYATISVADQINVSRTGGVGSIGVVTMHVDVSKALADDGYKITFIHAGKHKVDGNAYEALSPEVKARIQARIDELYQVFVSTVARNRPQLSEEEIRATEALCFTANEAVSNKLADSIGSLDDSLAAFAVSLSTPTDGDEAMTTKTHDEKEVAAAVATAVTAEQTKNAAAVAEAKKAERARVAGITGHAEAKGREALATHIAMNTDMSIEDAVAMLSASPKAEVAAPAAADPAAPFAAAMDADKPDVGAGGGKPGGDDAKDGDKSKDVLALVTGVNLNGFNKAA